MSIGDNIVKALGDNTKKQNDQTSKYVNIQIKLNALKSTYISLYNKLNLPPSVTITGNIIPYKNNITVNTLTQGSDRKTM